MDRKKQIEICKSCKNKKISWQQGIICSLTDAVPEFEESCPEYQEEITEKKEHNKDYIGKQERKGEQKLTSILVLLIIMTIISNIIQVDKAHHTPTGGILSILVQIVLFHYVLRGKEWAKIIVVTLICFAILFTIINMISFFMTERFYSDIIDIVMLIFLGIIATYSYGIYLLNADKNCIKYFKQ
ncbi:MAG: hypothetical protein LBT56_02720, partial [Prevotellaceae bacterium]|nr:hypothetical protein [Prevotellaceae bacterium]